MGAIGDAMALEDQEKIDQQAAAAAHAREYNLDGTLKADNYHPPALPGSTFPPGLTRGGGEFHVDRGQLMTVANNMKTDLASLVSALQGLYGGGAGGATLAGWGTAEAVGNNAGSAFYGISTFLSDLNQVYDTVIGNLHQTAANYDDADSATATAASKVGSESAPSAA
jgi:hypothetical protein